MAESFAYATGAEGATCCLALRSTELLSRVDTRASGLGSQVQSSLPDV